MIFLLLLVWFMSILYERKLFNSMH